MAVVNVDYSEFETLKNRVKELEETVKEKDKTIASSKTVPELSSARKCK